MHLLVERMEQEDSLPDLFADLLYTLVLQLGSSQGLEAGSPVLKTWRLVHAGALPLEMTLQRCAGRGGAGVQAVCGAVCLGWA